MNKKRFPQGIKFIIFVFNIMIISNLRNPTDLENKRRLQQQLIELEIANEAELERRVKDFKDPNKALPVAPQTKTNAELRKDRIENERQAIKNMEDLGFDYSRGAELVAWLSSSEVDKLADFNANFKGIKKELVETTNPKLLTTEYLKNYLERYFEDLDVSYGRKFAQQTQRETQITLSVDDLIENIPNPDTLLRLKQSLIDIQGALRNDLVVLTQQISTLNGELATEAVVRQQRDLQKEIERRMKERDDIRITRSKGYLLIALLDLYTAVIPSPEFFATLKLGLPIQERTDLVRRYGRLFDKIKALNTTSTEELLDEADNAGNYQLQKMLYNKMERALSFLSNNKGVDLISSLSRNYENELAKQGKQVELEKIKRFNDIQEQQKQEAEESIRNFYVHPIVDEADIHEPSRTSTSTAFARNFASGNYADDIERQQDPAEIDRMIEIESERQLALGEIAHKRALKLQVEQDKREALVRQLQGISQAREQKEIAEQQAQELARQKQIKIKEMKSYYESLINELDSIVSPKARVFTIRNLMEKAGINTIVDGGLSFSTNEQAENVYQKLRTKVINWITSNRIQPFTDGTLPFDYDLDGSQGRALSRAEILTASKTSTGNSTIKGLGLRKALKSHFKEDEEELMDMAKELRRHKKKEQMIDEYAESSEYEMGVSSPYDERGVRGGGALGFKHRRIKVGKGIALKERQPHYKTFGKYVIHMGHLIDKNIANFKYPSLGSIASIRPLNISDDYKEFILDTLENERPNERILRKLPIEEQKHFERVILGAGLLDTFQIKRVGDKDEKKEVDRFNILRGEILAGNNNEDVIKELKGLVVKFINEGKIRRQEGLNMLMELSVI